MGQLATQVDELVFLYELAIELDMRSIELAENASRVGLGDLGPTSEINREQAAALRAACHRTPAEQPPASANSGAALAAPAGWGTAMAHEAARATPPPPPVAARDEVAAPSLRSQGPLLPPPPPPGSSTAAPAPSWGSPAPAAPTGPQFTGDEDRSWRDAPGQIAAVAAVLVLVIALFVFMAVQSGRNDDRRERLRSAVPTTTAQREVWTKIDDGDNPDILQGGTPTTSIVTQGSDVGGNRPVAPSSPAPKVSVSGSER